MSDKEDLAKTFAARRGKVYPAHTWLAEKFPDYVEVMLELDEVIRRRPRRYDERMHELFHIVALAVKGSNFHNQPHLRAHIKKGLQLCLHLLEADSIAIVGEAGRRAAIEPARVVQALPVAPSDAPGGAP